MWKLFDEKTIEECLMVLAYNPDWICEGFCPDGIREGYYCMGIFYSAKWDNDMDSWHPEEGFPAYYMEKPKFVEPVDPNQLEIFS